VAVLPVFAARFADQPVNVFFLDAHCPRMRFVLFNEFDPALLIEIPPYSLADDPFRIPLLGARGFLRFVQ
jgi:hypothetical protein